jgi:hypothetical protein
MLRLRERGEAYTGVWWRNLSERVHLEDPGVDGRMILHVVCYWGIDQALAFQATVNLVLLLDLHLRPFLTFILREMRVQWRRQPVDIPETGHSSALYSCWRSYFQIRQEVSRTLHSVRIPECNPIENKTINFIVLCISGGGALTRGNRGISTSLHWASRPGSLPP